MKPGLHPNTLRTLGETLLMIGRWGNDILERARGFELLALLLNDCVEGWLWWRTNNNTDTGNRHLNDRVTVNIDRLLITSYRIHQENSYHYSNKIVIVNSNQKFKIVTYRCISIRSCTTLPTIIWPTSYDRPTLAVSAVKSIHYVTSWVFKFYDTRVLDMTLDHNCSVSNLIGILI